MKRCTGCGTYEHELPSQKEINPNMISCCPDNNYLELTPMRELRKYLFDLVPKFKQIASGQITEDQMEHLLKTLIDDLDVQYIKQEDAHLIEAVKIGHNCGHLINADALAKKYLEMRYNTDVWNV